MLKIAQGEGVRLEHILKCSSNTVLSFLYRVSKPYSKPFLIWKHNELKSKHGAVTEVPDPVYYHLYGSSA